MPQVTEPYGLPGDVSMDSATPTTPESLLPAPTLADLRLTRAQVSRLFGCSKQAVSEWTRKGILTFGADERIAAVMAVRQLLERGDVNRMRVRVLRDVAREIAAQRERTTVLEAERDALLGRIRSLEASLAGIRAAERAGIQAARFRFGDEQAARLAALSDAVVREWSTLIAAFHRGGGEEVSEVFDELVGGIFYSDNDTPAVEVDAADDELPHHNAADTPQE